MNKSTTIIETAKKFCDDSVEIALVLNGTFFRQFIIGENGERFSKKQVFTSEDLNLEECEIHRSIVCANGDILVTLDIDFHNDDLREGLRKALAAAHKVEKVFPGQFLWAFSGRCIHGHSYLRYTRDNEKHVIRYGKVYDFCKAINLYLKTEHFIDIDGTFNHYKGLVKSMGSYHKKTGLYKIPITLDMGISEILTNSQNLKFDTSWTIPNLDVDLVRQIVPVYNFYVPKDIPENTNKVEVNIGKYPKCILELMALQTKGNKIRFDLLRYFLYLHTKSDVLELMKTILTKDEFNHMVREKQLEHVYTRKYPPMSARYIKNTYSLECDRPNPTILDWEPINREDDTRCAVQ